MSAEGLPSIGEDPVILGLQTRVQRLLGEIEHLNRVKGPGEPEYCAAPNLEIACQLDALVSLLVAGGGLDLRVFITQTLMRQAEQLEQAVAAFREHKRQTTGIIVPGQNGRHG
jgi:hypothetical protein